MVAIAAAVALTAPAGAEARVLLRDPHDAAGPVDVRKVTADQSGRALELAVRTRSRAPLAALSHQPRIDRAGETRYLCLRMRRDDDRLLCVAATEEHGRSAFLGSVTPGGTAAHLERVRGLQVRQAGDVVRVKGSLGAFGLRPGRVRLTALSDWTGPPCVTKPSDPSQQVDTSGCRDRAPNRGAGRLRVVRPRIVGCRRDEHLTSTHGSRNHPRVAITFDDGPGPYTDDVLRILGKRHVKATFFVLGQAVSAYPGLVRRELRAGHEVGNHSTYHRANPPYGDIRTTSRRIRAATGFTPCVFRPPYGSLSNSTASAAWDLGMSSILWDVDPQDWRRPGSGAIAQNVIANTRDGSIILLHDAGGDRRQTVAALPRVLDTLRQRGYRFVTVTRLLRERLIWKP